MAAKSKEKSVSKSISRLLDANLNRCREGARVLEDTARFIFDDADFFRLFRRERHKLDILTRKLYPELVASRNSQEDEGRTIKEGARSNIDSLIFANFRRCEESLRVLEEYSKLFSARAGSEFKEIRFAVYQLEKDVMRKWKLKHSWQ